MLEKKETERGEKWERSCVGVRLLSLFSRSSAEGKQRQRQKDGARSSESERRGKEK